MRPWSVPGVVVAGILQLSCTRQTTTVVRAQYTCPLSLLIPFRDDRELTQVGNDIPLGGSLLSQDYFAKQGLSLLFVALMAIEDFNERTSTLIPDLLTEYGTCGVVFPPPILVDSGRSAERIIQQSSTWKRNDTCAVIGPVDNLATQAVGNLLLGTSIPAISYGATAPILSNATYFPNVALANVQWEDTVQSLTEYLVANERTRAAILYTAGANFFNSEEILSIWSEAADAYPLTVLVSFISSRTYDEFKARFEFILENELTTIVVALHRDDDIEVIAEVADELGLLSDEYHWILMNSFLSPQSISAIYDPPPVLETFLLRSTFFQVLDGLAPTLLVTNSSVESQAQQMGDVFREEWESRVVALSPSVEEILNAAEGIRWNESSLENLVPGYGSSFLYDAIMNMGMSACIVGGGSPLDVDHLGPTGNFSFRNRSLDPTGVEFGIFSVSKMPDGQFVPLLEEVTKAGLWKETIRPAVVVEKFLPIAARAIGMLVASLSIVFSVSCAVFVYYFRKNRIVSVGQPEFLYMICGGSVMMVLSIFFLSADEDTGWSIKKLGTGCILAEWFRYLGILIVYLALFSKLWRVERVTQIRRGQRIQFHHVLGPFAGMLVLASILLLVETIVKPPWWERTELQRSNKTVSVGFCHQSNGFILPRQICTIAAVGVTLWMSGKTKHLPEEVSDSFRVSQTLYAHLGILVLYVVIQVLALQFSSSTVIYFNEVLLQTAFAVFSLVFLIGTKMYFVWQFKKTGQMPASLQRGRTHVTGLASTVPTTAGSSNFTQSQNRAPASSTQSQTEANMARWGLSPSPAQVPSVVPNTPSMMTSIPVPILEDSPSISGAKSPLTPQAPAAVPSIPAMMTTIPVPIPEGHPPSTSIGDQSSPTSFRTTHGGEILPGVEGNEPKESSLEAQAK